MRSLQLLLTSTLFVVASLLLIDGTKPTFGQGASPGATPAATAPVCGGTPKPANAGGASISITEGTPAKQWQPPGGELHFTVVSFNALPPASQVLVCFSWVNGNGQVVERRPKNIELSLDGKTLKVTTTVPNKLPVLPANMGRYELWLVPLMEVRILILDTKGGSTLVDVSANIGVSNRFWAAVWALFFVIAAFFMLDWWARRRLTHPGILAANPILRVISTPSGYASLSQFQIMLWTFVVGGSAVYVIALSGELIPITTGTLILLGISGASTIGTQVVNQNPAAPAAPPAVAAPPPPPPPHPRPLWSDLIMGNDREVDVTRVQMLYFTLITAVFVVLKVATTYVIPEIPEGFQILMGISNAVYMGSKVAKR